MDDKSLPSLLARRCSWPEEVNFGVRSHNGCLTWVYIYVTKCGATLCDPSLDEELEGPLKTAWGRYHDRQFHFFHPERFRHWGQQETLGPNILIALSEALDYVKALLMTTRDAIAPVIDSKL